VKLPWLWKPLAPANSCRGAANLNVKCGAGVVPKGYRVSIGAQFVRPDIKQSSSLPSV